MLSANSAEAMSTARGWFDRLFSALCLCLICPGSIATAGIILGNQTDALPNVRTTAQQNLVGQGIMEVHEIRTAFKAGDHERCARLLNELVGKDPGLPPVEVMFVWLLLSDGQLAEAKVNLERVATMHPQQPHVFLTLGQIALSERRLADASVHLEKAVGMPLPSEWPEPQRQRFAFQGLDILSAIYELQRRWQSAKQTLDAAINLRPLDTGLKLRLARALFHLGEEQASREILIQVAEKRPNLPSVPLQFAQYAFSAGDATAVNEWLAQASETHADDPRTFLWQAEWLIISGEPLPARAALEQAQQLSADGAKVLDLSSQVAMLTGEYEEAIRLLQEAIDVPSRTLDSTLAIRLAMAVVASSQKTNGQAPVPPETLQQIEDLAVSSSASSQTISLLGWLYHVTGRREEARLMLARGSQMTSHLTPDQVFFMADFLGQSEEADDRQKAVAMLEHVLQQQHTLFLLRPLAESIKKKLTAATAGP